MTRKPISTHYILEVKLVQRFADTRTYEIHFKVNKNNTDADINRQRRQPMVSRIEKVGSQWRITVGTPSGGRVVEQVFEGTSFDKLVSKKKSLGDFYFTVALISGVTPLDSSGSDDVIFNPRKPQKPSLPDRVAPELEPLPEKGCCDCGCLH